MKTKLEIDTECIANYCGVSAKNSHSKISSYHLTLRKPFVEALGINVGDTVDVAILQVNKGLPKMEGPGLQEIHPPEEPRNLDKSNEEGASNSVPVIALAPDNTSTRKKRAPRKKKGGKRGSLKRGRRGGK